MLANKRITGMASKNWQITHWIYLILFMILLPICVFLFIFSCSPVAAMFTLQAIAKHKTIKCLNVDAISTGLRSLHVITDLLLLPIPIIIIWQLQMRLFQKIRLMLVFCVGLISSIASIIALITDSATFDFTCMSLIPCRSRIIH